MAEWQTRTVEGRVGNTVLVQVQSAAPYRVFITDLSYEHSIFLCINRFPQYVGAGFMPALLFYADLVIYSTVTPFRVSAL